jgi:ATP-dependent RNA helicase DeaD
MNFSDLNLPPAVARALANRGYDSATPVQAAVLDVHHESRDLLVSSQTGSGKTVAFGAAMARMLLAPSAAERKPTGGSPIALVVVPTRELAIQVRDELGWLLRETGLKLASFTGGTQVGGDLRALQKGIDVGIGTPGRLVDLLRRQRLDLAHIQVVVLDEADEMLDLGFREDLQLLLQAAPETRRTLLLSATLPPEIRALARQFQKDPLHIDPRKDSETGGREAHDDITFVAHLISGSDRLAVVVNVLRAAGPGRAIVFCTTREGVSRLHAALVARGFAATAISGERAQAERDRALGQVRSGNAQVLVATNVAARGLHLPDVDLIVHADLPLNAESLTHRSGRTGRAGRKGTAVVIAGMSERRKAERLLSSANIPVVWTAPPAADAITAAARERLAQELLAEAPADAADQDPAIQTMVEQLQATLSAEELARRLLRRELTRLPVGEQVHPVPIPRPGSSRTADFHDGGDERGGRRPGRSDFARHGELFRVNIGAKDNADPRWLLPLFCRRGGVTSRDVGAIRVGPRETTFEIAGEAAADFALSASEPDPRAPHVIIERASKSQHASAGSNSSPRPYSNPPPPYARPNPNPNVNPRAERASHRPASVPHQRATAQRERERPPERQPERRITPPREAKAAHTPVAPPRATAPSRETKPAHTPVEPPRANTLPRGKKPYPVRAAAMPPTSAKSFEVGRAERPGRPRPPAPLIEMKRPQPPRAPFWKDAARRRPSPGTTSRPPGSDTPKRRPQQDI